MKLFGCYLPSACLFSFCHINPDQRPYQTELNLTASVGIAPNKFLAKLPPLPKNRTFCRIREEEIQNFLDPCLSKETGGRTQTRKNCMHFRSKPSET
jgi:hypothetical protein